MKKILFTIIKIIFLFLFILIVVLTTTGIETNKLNQLIFSKIKENNNNISLKLEKIKFKFSIKNLNLLLETKKPKLIYQNLIIPIEKIEVYLDFISLIKTKTKINKMKLTLEEIGVDQLKNIILKTKPSSLNSLITNKVKNGKLLLNLELYFKDDLNLDNFIARGVVKEMEGTIFDNLTFKKTSFNFFSDNSDLLIKDVTSEMDGILIKSGNLKIKKGKNISIKSEFLTESNIDKNNIQKYLTYLKNEKYINKKTNFKASLNHNMDITFDNTFKVIDYVYKSKGKVNELNFEFKKPIKNIILEKDIKNFRIKDSNFSFRYGLDKQNYISAIGIYSINNYSYKKYDLTNNFLNDVANIKINFELAQKFNIDIINYKKKPNAVAKISTNFVKKKDLINFQEIIYKENKNSILVKKLIINKKNIISLQKIKVKTFIKGYSNNDFSLNFGKKIYISGTNYDAKNLSKILNNQSKNNLYKKISKSIDINFKNIETPLSKKLKNFRLIGEIQNGKFIKISSKGDFGDDKFLDISLKLDKKNEKRYLEIYSDLPQPLLSEYSFFKGLSGGKLIFSSILENNLSKSKLIIENFKIIDAPGVVKLLSLADFGGLADLAEGEGLSFEKLEINMSKNNNLLKLEELFAVGPSISVLMEGYKDFAGLTSLKGTLVPAKNLNKLLSKIPIIGKIIIPQEVGEGLFGVSFKMKGMPGEIKTTINPIKTLTPRFITKALERSKKSK
jgi:hypothetical protein